MVIGKENVGGRLVSLNYEKGGQRKTEVKKLSPTLGVQLSSRHLRRENPVDALKY